MPQKCYVLPEKLATAENKKSYSGEHIQKSLPFDYAQDKYFLLFDSPRRSQIGKILFIEVLEADSYTFLPANDGFYSEPSVAGSRLQL